MSDLSVELAKWLQKLPESGRLLGVDLGEKKLGLALSDTTRLIASPYKALIRQGNKRDAVALVSEVTAHQVVGICFGLPRQMWGEEGETAQKARRFADEVATHTDVPICFWDERWSTMGVERTLLEADMSRKRRAEVIDKLAACYILQGLLDWIRGRLQA